MTPRAEFDDFGYGVLVEWLRTGNRVTAQLARKLGEKAAER